MKQKIAFEPFSLAGTVGTFDKTLDHTVETFAIGVGNAMDEEVEDLLKMSSEHTSNLLDRFQLAAHSVAVPVLEEGRVGG